MTQKSASLSYAQLPDLVRLNILEFLSYSELLELHRSDSLFHYDIWYVVRKRVLNEPFEFMIDVTEYFEWCQQPYFPHWLEFRLLTPIICKETLDMDFEIKVNNCLDAYELDSAFEEYHRDAVVLSYYGHSFRFIISIADINNTSISPLWLQTQDLRHSRIDQALSEGVQSDHISLSYSPKMSQIHYTAYRDDYKTAEPYTHKLLIQDDSDIISVRFDKFRCSLLWWQYAITLAEKVYTTKDR